MKPVASIVMLACGLWSTGAAASPPLALPAPPQVRFMQRPGTALPLDAPMVESDGRTVRLRDLFDGKRAVMLVPGYYRCAELCGLVMQGILEALAASALPVDAWRIVGFSIDPEDTPATARVRERQYRDYARHVSGNTGETADRIDLHLLTSSGATAQRLTGALGYAVERGAAGGTIAHSAGFVVTTPAGVVSRYFPGVRFDAREFRLAVVEAAGGRVGSLSDRLTLLCGHYDPVTGRYSFAVMAWLRLFGCIGAIGLGAWIWRRRAPGTTRR